MKKLNLFITGLAAFAATILLVPDTHAAAGICNLNGVKTHYLSIYCGIRLNDNEGADSKIVKTLATQFDMKEDTIKEILAGTICNKYVTYSAEEKAKQPKAVQDACLPSGNSIEQTLGSWSVFTDIRNAYEKENVIQRSAASLKFKFKASEQYWNGTLTDGPFDLIVDLNLMEIILFGSKAQWMQDVYKFPKDESGGQSGETPMDSALPPDQGTQEPTTPGGNTETGVAVTEGTETPGTSAPDCVTPDDQDADNGDGPGSNYKNPSCGNGKVDILLAEQCDDGNKQSGDGCNQYCKTEASGSNDQCIDPEAVTFKDPPKAGGNEGSGETGGNTGNENTETKPGDKPDCPPGTVPKKTPMSLTGSTGGEVSSTAAQSPEYPGPNLGGTLKQYPASNPPVCGPGETLIKTNDDGTPVCWQTEFCASPDLARDFLLPTWRTDPILKSQAEAIEALFCVNITKMNRPTSPYQLIEGCIDCHITAMADAVEKALQTNVSPLVNTTSAFSISSKYGPAFSFNLNTAPKNKLKYKTTDTAGSAIKRANENEAESKRNNTPAKIDIHNLKGPIKYIDDTADKAEKAQAAIQEDTRMFNLSNGVIIDQEVGGRIIPLITQMRDSFINIESQFEQMVGDTAFDKKEQCPQ